MEPTYEYVKGHGWQVTTVESALFTYEGKAYRVIACKPQEGQICIWSSKGNTWYMRDGKPILDRWADFLARNFEHTRVYCPAIEEEAFGTFGEYINWVTIIPL